MQFAKKWNILGAAGIAAFICVVLAAAFFMRREDGEFVDYAAFLQAVQAGHVTHVYLSDAPTVRFAFADSGGTYITNHPRRADFKEMLLVAGVGVTESTASGVDFIALGVTAVLVGGVVCIARARRGGTAMAKSGIAPVTVGVGTDEARIRTTFDDVAGNPEAKESVADIIAYLRAPGHFARYGARMPRGILLHGKPGTGKTLLARAMAGEAGVPFYAVSGSDFVQMYVGVGAARVREIFAKAREKGRGVIFIDEIDALGKKRGDGINGNDEREQTLNALLTEMQGFSENSGIVVVAATNRADTLDEALLRPGRFDRRVEVGLPDIAARRQIIALHAHAKPMAADFDAEKLARDTVFFSGAMLEGLLNDAAISAARRHGATISERDLSEAYYTALVGVQKKDRSALRDTDREITAYHEAGHALAAILTSRENRIARLTIIPSASGAGGFCVNLPPERMYHTKREVEAQIITALAGRAAEEIRFGTENITTGAANDLEKAADLALQYITRFGFGAELFNQKQLGATKAAARECNALAARLYSEARQLLQENKTALEKLAAELLHKETLSGEEVGEIIRPLCPEACPASSAP